MVYKLCVPCSGRTQFRWALAPVWQGSPFLPDLLLSPPGHPSPLQISTSDLGALTGYVLKVHVSTDSLLSTSMLVLLCPPPSILPASHNSPIPNPPPCFQVFVTAPPHLQAKILVIL